MYFAYECVLVFNSITVSGRFSSLDKRPVSLALRQRIIFFIRRNAEDFVNAMRWNTTAAKPAPIQRTLFQELTEEENRIVQLLAQHGDLQINALTVESNLPISQLSGVLFELEMKGIIKAQAGNVYHLLG